VGFWFFVSCCYDVVVGIGGIGLGIFFVFEGNCIFGCEESWLVDLFD